MKFLFYIVLLAMAASLHAVEPDCDVSKLLQAIAAKEGQAQDAIGPNGERSIYGITKAVWMQHMPYLPFEYCTEQPFLARICATKHINLCANELAKAGYPPSVYCIAAAWHSGLKGYIALAKAGRESEYGRDVANLYGTTQ